MKIRNLCALLLALMLLALAGCGQKEQPTQPENPDVPQEEETVPVRLVCSNGSTTLRFSREEDGHWLWADDKTFPLDESYALTLLETVQGIESLPPVTTAAQLADYGLESSAKYVTLTDSQDTSVTYRLGSESDGSVYVYREGAEATVYAVPDLLGQIGRSIYDMMALPELPQLTAENVTSLTAVLQEAGVVIVLHQVHPAPDSCGGGLDRRWPGCNGSAGRPDCLAGGYAPGGLRGLAAQRRGSGPMRAGPAGCSSDGGVYP